MHDENRLLLFGLDGCHHLALLFTEFKLLLRRMVPAPTVVETGLLLHRQQYNSMGSPRRDLMRAAS